MGCNALDLLRRQGGAEEYEVIALTGNKNVELLAQQAKEFKAGLVVADEASLPALKEAIGNAPIEVAAGHSGLSEAASRESDWCLSAIVGAAGLEPTLIAAENTRTLALANKESLVCAGELLKRTCAKHKTTLLPVDSEHSAIFQALRGENAASIDKIILTASGGPFWQRSREEMAKVTLAEAVAHPNWDMGQRISIDSATMFNKALEVIETKELFDVAPDQMDVLIHPQSIIHSMVSFKDGAVMAQLGAPDMRGPIGFALNYPDRAFLPVERLDLAALSQLDFAKPDMVRFPALSLAFAVCNAAGYTGCVLNAAKEVALDGFIDGTIGFLDMSNLVSDVLDRLSGDASGHSGQMRLVEIRDFDRRARSLARDWMMSGKYA